MARSEESSYPKATIYRVPAGNFEALAAIDSGECLVSSRPHFVQWMIASRA